MKNPRHELKRKEHKKKIKRAGGILLYRKSKLLGAKKARI